MCSSPFLHVVFYVQDLAASAWKASCHSGNVCFSEICRRSVFNQQVKLIYHYTMESFAFQGFWEDKLCLKYFKKKKNRKKLRLSVFDGIRKRSARHSWKVRGRKGYKPLKRSISAAVQRGLSSMNFSNKCRTSILHSRYSGVFFCFKIRKPFT